MEVDVEVDVARGSPGVSAYAARAPRRRPADARLPPPHTTTAADQLLSSKKGRALVAAYEQREAAAVGYLRAINPGVAVYAGPLSDPKASSLGAVGQGMEGRPCLQ